MTIGVVGLVRIVMGGTPWPVTLPLTCSIVLIVLVSVVMGTLLPLVLRSAGFSPEHAGPAIQVIMDICGVLITCVVCDLMLT